MERGELSFSAVQVLVLDEADRMADMGFLPQVQKILHRVDGEHQTMLFSATLDRGIDRLVARYLHDPLSHEVESSEETVEEMHHRFLLVHQMDKVKVVGRDLARRRPHARVLPHQARRRQARRAAHARAREGRGDPR